MTAIKAGYDILRPQTKTGAICAPVIDLAPALGGSLSTLIKFVSEHASLRMETRKWKSFDLLHFVESSEDVRHILNAKFFHV